MARPRRQPPQQPPPEPKPSTRAPEIATLIGVGAGGAAAEAGTGLTKAAVSRAAKHILDAFVRFAKQRQMSLLLMLEPRLRQEFPQYEPDAIAKLVREEARREVTFQRKQRERLARDLPKALEHADPARRVEAVQQLLDRERRYLQAREEAIAERAYTAVEMIDLQRDSPQGAFWKLSEGVKEHTVGCLAMGNQFWPWSVLRVIHPQLHFGCACHLYSLDEAVERGFMEADQVPDPKDAERRAASIQDKIRHVYETTNAIERETYLEELEEQFEVEEALRGVRYGLKPSERFGRGTTKGGQFKPRRGGVPGKPTLRGIVRKALKLAVPDVPKLPRQERIDQDGEWLWIRGRHVFVPKHRAFNRKLDGIEFTSPPGSGNLYRNGYLVHVPGEALPHHGDLDKPTPGDPVKPDYPGGLYQPPKMRQERQKQIEDEARALYSSEHERIDAKVKAALDAQLRGVFPIDTNDEAAIVATVLTDNGFYLSKIDQDVVNGPYGATWLHPSRASVTEYVKDGKVVDFDWIPGGEVEVPDLGDTPPDSWGDFVTDLTAVAHEVAGELGRKPDLHSIEVGMAGNNYANHTGSWMPGGYVTMGEDVPRGIEMLQRAKAEGRPLTEFEAGEVYISYYTGVHEMLHAAAPITISDYSNEDFKAMEEGLNEEMTRLVTANTLRRIGLPETLQFIRNNPQDARARGSYPYYRQAIDRLLTAAQVPAEEREDFIRHLRFEVAPRDRARVIGDRIAANPNPPDFFAQFQGDPVNATGWVEVQLRVAQIDNTATFEPLLQPDLDDTPFEQPYLIDGKPLRTGTPVIAMLEGREVRGRVGQIHKIDTAGDPDIDPVMFGIVTDDMELFSNVMPREVTFLASADEERDAVVLPDGTEVREGDVIRYDNRADGKLSEAVVEQIIRTGISAPDPLTSKWEYSKNEWSLVARTTENSLKPDHSVILTLGRAGGVVERAPDTARPDRHEAPDIPQVAAQERTLFVSRIPELEMELEQTTVEKFAGKASAWADARQAKRIELDAEKARMAADTESLSVGDPVLIRGLFGEVNTGRVVKVNKASIDVDEPGMAGGPRRYLKESRSPDGAWSTAIGMPIKRTVRIEGIPRKPVRVPKGVFSELWALEHDTADGTVPNKDALADELERAFARAGGWDARSYTLELTPDVARYLDQALDYHDTIWADQAQYAEPSERASLNSYRRGARRVREDLQAVKTEGLDPQVELDQMSEGTHRRIYFVLEDSATDWTDADKLEAGRKITQATDDYEEVLQNPAYQRVLRWGGDEHLAQFVQEDRTLFEQPRKIGLYLRNDDNDRFDGWGVTGAGSYGARVDTRRPGVGTMANITTDTPTGHDYYLDARFVAIHESHHMYGSYSEFDIGSEAAFVYHGMKRGLTDEPMIQAQDAMAWRVLSDGPNTRLSRSLRALFGDDALDEWGQRAGIRDLFNRRPIPVEDNSIQGRVAQLDDFRENYGYNLPALVSYLEKKNLVDTSEFFTAELAPGERAFMRVNGETLALDMDGRARVLRGTIDTEGVLTPPVARLPEGVMSREEFENHPETWWHGTRYGALLPQDEAETSGQGFHVGTYEAARQALAAQTGWDMGPRGTLDDRVALAREGMKKWVGEETQNEDGTFTYTKRTWMPGTRSTAELKKGDTVDIYLDGVGRKVEITRLGSEAGWVMVDGQERRVTRQQLGHTADESVERVTVRFDGDTMTILDAPPLDAKDGQPRYALEVAVRSARDAGLGAQQGDKVWAEPWDGKPIVHRRSGALVGKGDDAMPEGPVPAIFPVRIVGPMTNRPYGDLRDDYWANGVMRSNLQRGRARRGMFYKNVSEDEGSVSAALPDRSFVQTYDEYLADGMLRSPEPIRTEGVAGDAMPPGEFERYRERLAAMDDDELENERYTLRFERLFLDMTDNEVADRAEAVDREIGGRFQRIGTEGIGVDYSAPEVEHPPIWQTPLGEYERFPYHDNPTDEDWSEYHQRKREWIAAIRRSLALGEVSLDAAEALGYRPPSVERRSEYADRDGRVGWAPMPARLYHATSAASAIREHGLKTRAELGQSLGRGLGGGEDDAISFTTDPKLAEDIRDALLEMRQVMRREVTPADLIERAGWGDRGSQPFLDDVIRQYDHGWKPGDPLPREIQDLMDGVRRNNSVLIFRASEIEAVAGPEWRLAPDAVPVGFKHASGEDQFSAHALIRDMTKEERDYAEAHFYKTFSFWREQKGGPADPMFFTSDTAPLADADPADIQVLTFEPVEGALGYPMSGMAEWRTASGRAVRLSTTESATIPSVEPTSDYMAPDEVPAEVRIRSEGIVEPAAPEPPAPIEVQAWRLRRELDDAQSVRNTLEDNDPNRKVWDETVERLSNETAAAEEQAGGRVYRYFPDQLDKANQKMRELGKRASKLGLPEPTLREVAVQYQPARPPADWNHAEREWNPMLADRVKVTYVLVDGAEPKIAGWEFVATLQHLEGINVIRRVPGTEEDVDLSNYRAGDATCDYCKTKRDRKDTYLVRKTTEDVESTGKPLDDEPVGSVFQIGKNCLRDFTGHGSPEQIAAYLEFWMSFDDLEDEDEGGPRHGEGRSEVPVEDYLMHVATMLRVEGWASRGEHGADSTADRAMRNRSDFIRKSKDKQGRPLWIEPNDDDERKANAALAWVREYLGAKVHQTQDADDFEHNMYAMAKGDVVPEKGEGILAYTLKAHAKFEEREIARRERAKVDALSNYVGVEGERLDLDDLVVMSVYEHEGNYGTTFITKLRDQEGNIFTWFGSSELERGSHVRAKWGVKKHEEFKGTKQTVLTRPANMVTWADGDEPPVEAVKPAKKGDRSPIEFEVIGQHDPILVTGEVEKAAKGFDVYVEGKFHSNETTWKKAQDTFEDAARDVARDRARQEYLNENMPEGSRGKRGSYSYQVHHVTYSPEVFLADGDLVALRPYDDEKYDDKMRFLGREPGKWVLAKPPADNTNPNLIYVPAKVVEGEDTWQQPETEATVTDPDGEVLRVTERDEVIVREPQAIRTEGITGGPWHDVLPEGYSIRQPQPLAASTAKAKWKREWFFMLRDLHVGGGYGWQEWGSGHMSSGITNALTKRRAIETATHPGSGRNYLYRLTPKGHNELMGWFEENATPEQLDDPNWNPPAPPEGAPTAPMAHTPQMSDDDRHRWTVLQDDLSGANANIARFNENMKDPEMAPYLDQQLLASYRRGEQRAREELRAMREQLRYAPSTGERREPRPEPEGLRTEGPSIDREAIYQAITASYDRGDSLPAIIEKAGTSDEVLGMIHDRLGVAMSTLRAERDRILNPEQAKLDDARAMHDNALNALQRAETRLSDAYEKAGVDPGTVDAPVAVQRAEERYSNAKDQAEQAELRVIDAERAAGQLPPMRTEGPGVSASAISRLLKAGGLSGVRTEHMRAGGEGWGKHAPSITSTVLVYADRPEDLDAAAELLTERGYNAERTTWLGGDAVIVRRGVRTEGIEPPPTPEQAAGIARRMSAVPNDQAVYIAEGAIERAGLDGGKLGWRLGHPNHPDEAGREESAKATAWAREISGDPTLTVHISNWGDALASYSPIYHVVTVRDDSTKLSFLHEVAHAMVRGSHEDGDAHAEKFITTARDLYREHLSPEAADIFWNLVGDRAGGPVTGALRTEGPGRKWKRIEDDGGVGYESGNARIWDNGPGIGPSKDGGKWALEIDGEWVANIDFLTDAKARAEEMLGPDESGLSDDARKALDIAREVLAKDRGSVTAALIAARAGEPFETRKWSSVMVGLANKGLLSAHADGFVGKTFYTLPGEGGAWGPLRTEGPAKPDLKWKKIEDGGYEDTTGTYRITRHEIDDTWDSGALVPTAVQWTFEQKDSQGEWSPVELHNRLSDAKRDAARAWARRSEGMRTEGPYTLPERDKITGRALANRLRGKGYSGARLDQAMEEVADDMHGADTVAGQHLAWINEYENDPKGRHWAAIKRQCRATLASIDGLRTEGPQVEPGVMRIKLQDGKWVVLAQWLGAERVVHTGQGEYGLFDAIDFVREQKAARTEMRTEGVTDGVKYWRRPVRVTFKPGTEEVDQVTLDAGMTGLNLNFWSGTDEQGQLWTIDTADVLRVEEMRYEDGKLVQREYVTDGPAKEHLDVLFLASDEKPWVGRLDEYEKDALGSYLDPDGFQEINTLLRTWDEGEWRRESGPYATREPEHVWESIWSIDEAIRKAPPTGEDLRLHLYRGIRDATAVFGSDGPQIGQTVTDPAFISTTTDIETARNFAQRPSYWMPDDPERPVMLEIELPAGIRGAWMSGIGHGPEFVLPRGSTLEVVGKYQEVGLKLGTTIDVIEMRYVDPNELVRTEGPLHQQPDLVPVYHGTGIVFDEFDATGGYYSSWGKGVYLTTDRGRAGRYALGDAPHIRMARVDDATVVDMLSRDPDYLDSIRANVDAVLTPDEQADLRSFTWFPDTSWDGSQSGVNLAETLTVWFNRHDSEDGKAEANAVLARAGYTGLRYGDEYLIFNPDDVLTPYGEPRTEGTPPTTVRLYHGTTNLALERSTEDVLRARSMIDLAHEVEDDFDLPRDSVWSHDWFMYERQFRNEGEVHLAAERFTAESYAKRGGEALEGALRAVWRIQKGEDAVFPHDGLPAWEKFKQDYLDRKGITPVVLALDVPVEQIPVPRDLYGSTTPDEWRAMLPLPGDYRLPEVDLNWQAAVVSTEGLPDIHPDDRAKVKRGQVFVHTKWITGTRDADGKYPSERGRITATKGDLVYYGVGEDAKKGHYYADKDAFVRDSVKAWVVDGVEQPKATGLVDERKEMNALDFLNATPDELDKMGFKRGGGYFGSGGRTSGTRRGPRTEGIEPVIQEVAEPRSAPIGWSFQRRPGDLLLIRRAPNENGTVTEWRATFPNEAEMRTAVSRHEAKVVLTDAELDAEVLGWIRSHDPDIAWSMARSLVGQGWFSGDTRKPDRRVTASLQRLRKAGLARWDAPNWHPVEEVRTEGLPARFWHITTSPSFQLEERRQGGVIHLTDDQGLAEWAPRLTWPRPREYAAEIEVTDPSQVTQTLTPSAREWQARTSAARVVRVVPLADVVPGMRTEGIPEVTGIDLSQPIDGLTVEYDKQGGDGKQTFRYLTVGDPEAEWPRPKRWGEISYRPTATGIWIDSIGVEKSKQGKGIATAMLDRLHRDTDQPIIHGSFSSHDGIRLGVTMAARYPEWNKLWLGYDDGQEVLWRPGEPISGDESTFAPIPYGSTDRVAETVEKALAKADGMRAEGRVALRTEGPEQQARVVTEDQVDDWLADGEAGYRGILYHGTNWPDEVREKGLLFGPPDDPIYSMQNKVWLTDSEQEAESYARTDDAVMRVAVKFRKPMIFKQGESAEDGFRRMGVDLSKYPQTGLKPKPPTPERVARQEGFDAVIRPREDGALLVNAYDLDTLRVVLPSVRSEGVPPGDPEPVVSELQRAVELDDILLDALGSNPREFYAAHDKITAALDDSSGLPVERVALTDLVPTQQRLDSAYAARLPKGLDPPFAVKFGGRTLLVDGHHRVEQQRVAGATDVDVRVLSLEQPKLTDRQRQVLDVLPSPDGRSYDQFGFKSGLDKHEVAAQIEGMNSTGAQRVLYALLDAGVIKFDENGYYVPERPTIRTEGIPTPQDTPQQKRVLRTNKIAQKVRAAFPTGTRVIVTPGAGAEPREGAMTGTILRHVPGTNSQGGYLKVRWDNGIEGRVNPSSVRPIEPMRTEGVTEIRVESWDGNETTVTSPEDAIVAAAKLWDDAGRAPGRPTINFYVNGRHVRTVNNRAELGPQLRTEGVGPPDPQRMFHVAPRAMRGSIEEKGLDYRQLVNVMPEADAFLDQLGVIEQGNYVWDNLDDALMYMRFWGGREFDLYVVDARDVALKPDPLQVDAAWMTVNPISPDRMRRVDPSEYQGVRSEGVVETTLSGRGFTVAREVALPDELPPLDNATVVELDGGSRRTVRLPVGSAGGLADRLDRFARTQATGDRRSDARAAADAAAALRRDFAPIRSEGIDNPASAVRPDFDEVEPVPGPDVGIHSTGGWGAAETLRDQYESSGTGGFGSGFYFVSTADRLSRSYIGEEGEARGRRLVGIDLTGKRLYHPWDEDSAFKLHDWLMDVNYLQHTDDDLDGYGIPGITDPYYARKYQDPLGEETVVQRLASRSVISGGPRVSPEEVRRAIEGARADLARDRESTRDSAATRLMRSVGYDGIDVRGLDERLDGTGMGSVLYRDKVLPEPMPVEREAAAQEVPEASPVRLSRADVDGLTEALKPTARGPVRDADGKVIQGVTYTPKLKRPVTALDFHSKREMWVGNKFFDLGAMERENVLAKEFGAQLAEIVKGEMWFNDRGAWSESAVSDRPAMALGLTYGEAFYDVPDRDWSVLDNEAGRQTVEAALRVGFPVAPEVEAWIRQERGAEPPPPPERVEEVADDLQKLIDRLREGGNGYFAHNLFTGELRAFGKDHDLGFIRWTREMEDGEERSVYRNFDSGATVQIRSRGDAIISIDAYQTSVDLPTNPEPGTPEHDAREVKGVPLPEAETMLAERGYYLTNANTNRSRSGSWRRYTNTDGVALLVKPSQRGYKKITAAYPDPATPEEVEEAQALFRSSDQFGGIRVGDRFDMGEPFNQPGMDRWRFVDTYPQGNGTVANYQHPEHGEMRLVILNDEVRRMGRPDPSSPSRVLSDEDYTEAYLAAREAEREGLDTLGRFALDLKGQTRQQLYQREQFQDRFDDEGDGYFAHSDGPANGEGKTVWKNHDTGETLLLTFDSDGNVSEVASYARDYPREKGAVSGGDSAADNLADLYREQLHEPDTTAKAFWDAMQQAGYEDVGHEGKGWTRYTHGVHGQSIMAKFEGDGSWDNQVLAAVYADETGERARFKAHGKYLLVNPIERIEVGTPIEDVRASFAQAGVRPMNTPEAEYQNFLVPATGSAEKHRIRVEDGKVAEVGLAPKFQDEDTTTILTRDQFAVVEKARREQVDQATANREAIEKEDFDRRKALIDADLSPVEVGEPGNEVIALLKAKHGFSTQSRKRVRYSKKEQEARWREAGVDPALAAHQRPEFKGYSYVLRSTEGDTLRLVVGGGVPQGATFMGMPVTSKSAILKAEWTPAPRLDRVLFDRPPVTRAELISASLGRTDELGERYGVETRVPTVITTSGKADHSGHHEWNGTIVLGATCEPSILNATKKIAAGVPLTKLEAISCYSAMETLQHEIGHGVNRQPIGAEESPDVGLEEALNEEIAHVHVIEWLHDLGMDEVVSWAKANPDEGVVKGTYLHHRRRLRELFDEAQVPEAERWELMQKMKFNQELGERFVELEQRLAAVVGGMNETEAYRHARAKMNYKKRIDKNNPIKDWKRILPLDEAWADITPQRTTVDLRNGEAVLGQIVGYQHTARPGAEPGQIGTVEAISHDGTQVYVREGYMDDSYHEWKPASEVFLPPVDAESGEISGKHKLDVGDEVFVEATEPFFTSVEAIRNNMVKVNGLWVIGSRIYRSDKPIMRETQPGAGSRGNFTGGPLLLDGEYVLYGTVLEGDVSESIAESLRLPPGQRTVRFHAIGGKPIGDSIETTRDAIAGLVVDEDRGDHSRLTFPIDTVRRIRELAEAA